MAMRVMNAIRKRLEVEVAIKDLFLYSSIAALADYILRQSYETMLPSIRVEERPEHIPLSFSQERLWFLDKLDGTVQYHLPTVLRLKGTLNNEALNYTLKNIVQRLLLKYYRNNIL